jgi:threonylcarbamoyladenosine tRNA methylthiotransferase MtaB
MRENEVITFGCRLNAFESEIIRGAAASAELEGAVIVNTCAVTAEAERQARQAIRRARRRHPDARIIVTGCAATLAPERYGAMPEVDRVVDNRAKLTPQGYRSAPTADGASRTAAAAEAINQPGHLTVAPPLVVPAIPAKARKDRPSEEETQGFVSLAPGPRLRGDGGFAPPWDFITASVDGFAGRSRAYLQVQQGCDHRCTFCIIPYARGPSRSVPLAEIEDRARRLVAAGCREIVLTGVDLTAYGDDLPGEPTLGWMARCLLAAVPDLPRLRLSSLDPAEIDPELWRLFAEEPRLMPHLHLSLQAGDNLILKRMKRRHSRAQAIAVARRARALRPDAALGADLIAGFPTEDEDMFRRSLDLVAEAGLAFLHVFPYNARPGTPAARMPPVPDAVVRERAARLRAAGETALAAELRSRIGAETDVLVERPGSGRADFYAAVGFEGPAVPGAIVRMRIAGSDGRGLVGAVLA